MVRGYGRVSIWGLEGVFLPFGQTLVKAMSNFSQTFCQSLNGTKSMIYFDNITLFQQKPEQKKSGIWSIPLSISLLVLCLTLSVLIQYSLLALAFVHHLTANSVSVHLLSGGQIFVSTAPL